MAEHNCEALQCCSCDRSIQRECDHMSSVVIVMSSPMMPDSGKALLCFECACKVNELIHPDLLTEPGYIASKDQVLAHRDSH